jgi:hypothetical protein
MDVMDRFLGDGCLAEVYVYVANNKKKPKKRKET